MDNSINISQSKYDDAISDSIYGSCPTKLTKCAKCGVLGQKNKLFRVPWLVIDPKGWNMWFALDNLYSIPLGLCSYDSLMSTTIFFKSGNLRRRRAAPTRMWVSAWYTGDTMPVTCSFRIYPQSLTKLSVFWYSKIIR